MASRKPIIGVVGAVGAGKSTVAREFGELGCAVVSADKLNHEVLRRKEVIEQIKAWWGSAVLAENGQIDREALGSVVFKDVKALEQLTGLVHPLIRRRQRELVAAAAADEGVLAVVLDVPLLLEVGQAGICDVLVFVEASEAVRYERIGRSRGWDAKKIKKIENLQLGLDKKAEISEYTISNNSCIPDLVAQVEKMLSEVLKKR